MTYLELMQTDVPYHGMDREMPKDRQAAAKELAGDIPAGVVAPGVPCRVLRPVTEDDRIQPSL